MMLAVGFCGDWFIFTCYTKLVAVHTTQSREAFVFDCSTADKKIKNTQDNNNSYSLLNSDGTSEEPGSDSILAFAVSPSDKFLALTDDAKRLVLFHCDPSWQCISIRYVVRRCTSLVFTQAEDELLVADKSGDVYSFSVEEPQREGELKMGHLSMLLAVTMSPDNRYIITADRDEKIRVSHLKSPYNIQSFCLGHKQFVSALLVPSAQPHYLLSGSGDGTLMLWDYESGQRLQSLDLGELVDPPSSEFHKDRKLTVSRINSSPDGHYIAVQCERASSVQFLTLQQESEEKLVPHSRLLLPYCPLDMTFDTEGRLWVLMDSDDAPLQVYRHTHSSWECDSVIPELNTVTEAFRQHWERLEASTRTSSNSEHLYTTSFDNVALYLQKKKQRLEEQQLKRTLIQESNNTKKKSGSGAASSS